MYTNEVQAKIKEKMEMIVERGKLNVPKALESIDKEFKERKDIIAKPAAISYEIDSSDRICMNIGKGDTRRLVPTSFAAGQLLNKCRIPATYGHTLKELKRGDLLVKNLTEMTGTLLQNGILIRHVKEVAKGVLSPSYRLMDASPIFESFVTEAIKFGMVPYNGLNTDYRYSIQFIMPKVYTPIEGEYVVYGAAINTSDYGAQALSLEMMVLRIVCSNLAIGNNVFRHVHIGRRFEFDDYAGDSVVLSGRTYKLDTATIASATKDAMKILPASFEELNDKIKIASTTGVTTVEALKMLKNKNLTKSMLQKAETLYDMNADVTQLPKEKSLWKLSNVISLIANEDKELSDDQRLDMQSLAMAVIQ
jgi:hypothetical protein